LRRATAWDQAVSARLARLTTSKRAGYVLATILAHTGDSALWLAGAALACALGQGDWVEGGRRVILATVVGGASILALKRFFQRRRPTHEAQGLYLSLDVHSFPSGHAGRSSCYVVLLAPLLPAPLRLGLWLWLGALCLSRVALGIHYALDVLGGCVVGSVIGWGLHVWLTN
jgi:undecaprenyl-diphosphatase